MVDYIENCAPFVEGVTVYDRIVGNAAALLLITIKCRTVFSALGSKNAIKTLAAAGIEYRFNETIDCIMNDPGTDMCPMEKLSLGKAPDEFFRALKARIVASSK